MFFFLFSLRDPTRKEALNLNISKYLYLNYWGPPSLYLDKSFERFSPSQKKTIHFSEVYCNTLLDCLYCFKNHYMTCDLYFQLLLCNDSLKVMSVMHCNKAHIIIPFIIHMILLKLASYRNQPMNLLSKPTDWFLNDTKFYRQVIFERTIIDVWSILN